MAATIKFWRNLLDKGVSEFNNYRRKYPAKIPNLAGQRLEFLNLSRIDLGLANLRKTTWFHVRLDHAVLYLARLQNSQMFKTDLCNADLGFAMWTKSVIKMVNLTGARMSHVDLSGSTIDSLILSKNSDLRSVDLRNSSFSYADFLRIYENLENPLSPKLQEEITRWRRLVDSKRHDLERVITIGDAYLDVTRMWKELSQALGIKI